MKSSTKQTYDHKVIESKWRDLWLKEKVFTADTETAKEKFYNLWMFPYPSGEGLHAGHAFASTGSDVFGKYRRMQGAEVFQPIGYDSFGIHSENYALKRGEHPQTLTEKTTENYQRQLQLLGHGYDWSRTVSTHTPEYYRWTQWLFVQLFKAGLAYRKKAEVNWCPSCKTVLADEQVIEGRCERCDSVVERRDLEQWFFRITAYAERLLQNLEVIDWPEKIKIAQRNWIGKKQGAEIRFQISNSENFVTVFTTRPDTVFGATFLVLAPEHEMLSDLLLKAGNRQVIEQYIAASRRKSDEDRLKEDQEKTGVILEGITVVNPATGKEMPVWVGDYVLGHYGTGAIMSVPAHDRRDFEFALKFGLPVKRVVKPRNLASYKSYVMGADALTNEQLNRIGRVEVNQDGDRMVMIHAKYLDEYKQLIRQTLLPGYWNEVVGDEVWFLFKFQNGETKEFILDDNNVTEIASLCSQFSGDPIEKTSNMWGYLGTNEWYRDLVVWDNYEGEMVNSGLLEGKNVIDAQSSIIEYAEKAEWGELKSTYHLRDWLISRQRYWGPPIPMIYCETCAKQGKSYFNQVESDDLIYRDYSDWSHYGWYPEDESHLPVELPYLEDYKPQGTGRGPLSDHAEFYTAVCPACKNPAKRETDVSDTFLDSAWYFLRYPSTNSVSSKDLPFDPGITKKWLPVDLYFGGAEHSVLHLMYARFVTQFLADRGQISFDEPFPRFFAHGLMIKDGAKMSKSKGNVVNPDQYIERYGADTLRLYLMFMGPMDGYPDFRDSGIAGMRRWVEKVWKLVNHARDVKHSNEGLIQLHQLIKGVTEDVERFKYNTAIAKMMSFTNWWQTNLNFVGTDQVESFILLLAPFAPYLSEELYNQLFVSQDPLTWDRHLSVHLQAWPRWNDDYLKIDTVEIPVQINGKVKLKMQVSQQIVNNASVLEEYVRNTQELASKVELKRIKKVIVVPGRLVNVLVN